MALTRNGLRMLSQCAVLPAHNFPLNQIFLVLDSFDALFTHAYAQRRAERCGEGLLMKTNTETMPCIKKTPNQLYIYIYVR